MSHSSRRQRLIRAGISVLLLVSAQMARAETSVSCSPGALTSAIATANSNGPASDTLSLAPGCTYRFTDSDANGDSALPPITTAIVISGNGATIERASDAATPFRLFSVSGALTLKDVTVRGGSAATGGGIANSGTLTLEATTITDNSATTDGGGIFNASGATLRISSSSITHNRSLSGQGGGIRSLGTLTVSTSTLSDNSAEQGGGLSTQSGTTTLINSTIAGNSAVPYYGGGIFKLGTEPLLVVNSTIAGNTSGERGGGMYLTGGGAVSVINTTLAGNAAPQGGGLYYGGAAATVANSIVWGNSSQIMRITSGLTVRSSLVAGGYTGTGNLSADPLFVAPADSTLAPTTAGDYQLQFGSPAIDAGDSAALPADSTDLDSDGDTTEPIPFDQAGNERIMGGSADLGAYERQPLNQSPTLDQPAPLTMLEDVAAQRVNLTGISAGVGESQTLVVDAASSNPSLIPAPTVSYTSPDTSGSLVVTPAADRSGTATITITVRDSGGTDDGATDTLTRTLTVNVMPVNDAPSFVAGPDQHVAASAGPQMVAGWASGFRPGPADEDGQTLLGYTITTSAPTLFRVLPAIDASGTLTYTPQPNTSGSAIITVAAQDSGGTADGGQDTSTAQLFTITVSESTQIYLPVVVRP